MTTIGLKFFEFLRPKGGTGTTGLREVDCGELFTAAQEYQIRELCFWVCANMVANALGRCEFRTFRGGEEIREREHYLWNVEPNVNQSSTAFLHKLVAQLYQDNEALIIPTRRRDGSDALVVADDWTEPEEYPSRQAEYRGVRVGEVTYDKTFREGDVLHLKLFAKNMQSVISALYHSYYRLVDAAIKNYQWGKGQHWKVHVSQLAAGDPEWDESFRRMIEAQVRPFLTSNGAILPEFDGYKFDNAGPSPGTSGTDSRDIRNMVEDIFEFTCRGFQIPAVLVNGTVEGTADANARFLSSCLDPLCDQLEEEINRKRYGYEQWRQGNYLRVDSSSILHFDLFAHAANVEKLVGSGAYTINDVRRACGQPVIPEAWADKHYMTLNITTLAENRRAAED